MSSVNIFTYGTLCVDKVMYAVTGKRFKTEKAYLKSYARYLVKDQVFPAIIPSDETKVVDGISYFNIDEESLSLIDCFESYFYDRILVDVTNDSDQTYKAYVYVLNKAYYNVLSEQAWDEAIFRQLHLKKYLNRIN